MGALTERKMGRRQTDSRRMNGMMDGRIKEMSGEGGKEKEPAKL